MGKASKLEKGKGLGPLIKDVNRVYGAGTLLPASEATSLVIDRLPIGIFDLDLKIGGGLPRGRMTMLKGDFSTGKSAICLLAAASAQRHCRYCGTPFEEILFSGEVLEHDCKCKKNEPMRVVWADAEGAFDPTWAARWGVTVEDLLVIATEYAEQAIDISDKCIRSKECDLLIVDSVASLTPSVEVEESSEKWQMGVMARLMNKAMRKWTSGMNSYGLLAKTKCTILLVNQMRIGIGGFRPTTTSPGGRGLDFHESLEVRFKRNGFILDPSTRRPIGVEVEYVIKKNKTAPPGPPGGAFKLYFVPKPGEYSIGDTDLDFQVFRLALFWGIIEKGGAWYTLPGGKRLQGKKAVFEAIRKEPGLIELLMEAIRERELTWRYSGESGIEVGDDEEDEDDEGDE